MSEPIMRVAGLTVYVQRKPIRHLYVRVVAPDGAVRVSVGPAYSEADIRSIIEQRMAWIQRQKNRIAAQEQTMPSRPTFTEGELVYFAGEAYRLAVHERRGPCCVHLVDTTLWLSLPPGCALGKRQQVIEAWYRKHLQAQIPAMLTHWSARMNVSVAQWRIRRMKTLWGSCNPRARRIWLNLDLARYPLRCLEYVLVHELVHLLERSHNARFYRLMDAFMPEWRDHRLLLR